jgi:SacI homology domain
MPTDLTLLATEHKTNNSHTRALLQIPSANPEADFRSGEMLQEFPVASYHYFCDSVDVTRPLPSGHPVTRPSWEFVWNAYLTQPLRERECNLPGIAPHLLQGLAECHALPDIHGNMFSVALFARRSRLHAGTRYKARGLNSTGAPANEIECEQAVLLQDGRWSSYVWRRGSVPLRWSQTVKANGVGTAIAIEQAHTFRGSRKCACCLPVQSMPTCLAAACPALATFLHPRMPVSQCQRTCKRIAEVPADGRGRVTAANSCQPRLDAGTSGACRCVTCTWRCPPARPHPTAR